MLWIALQGLRGRKGPFAGAFVALAVASALVMACGTLLQAGLRSHAPVERYAATPIVVAGEQTARIEVGTQNSDSVPLFERARVSAALVSRIAAVPGVRSAIPDISVPAAPSRSAWRGGRTHRPSDLAASMGHRRADALRASTRAPARRRRRTSWSTPALRAAVI